jgi:hypothetical protein
LIAPAVPAEPINPLIAPAVPAEPINPLIAPAVPAEPINPLIAPAVPAEPINPVIAPAVPAEPINPLIAPAVPAEPINPLIAPAVPAEPINPLIEPAVPAEPSVNNSVIKSGGRPIIRPVRRPIVKQVIKTDGIVNNSNVKIIVENKINTNNTVKQGVVSPSISYFSPFFFKIFDLKKYNNTLEPCVFFGCYDIDDLNKILKHSGYKIIIWAGSDSDYKRRDFAKKALFYLKNTKKIFHIAISDYIYSDLQHYHIPCKKIPFCIKNIDSYNPVSKGKSIYFYTSIVNPTLYGCMLFSSIYEKLKNKYNFIIGTCEEQMKYKKHKNTRKYPFLQKAHFYKNMKTVYSDCFVGLRLTKHDGNANTVQELGMYGIKCFYNGDDNLKNTIKWKDATDIIKNIEIEARTIGNIDIDLSKKVKDYLKPNNDWLNINYYTY